MFKNYGYPVSTFPAYTRLAKGGCGIVSVSDVLSYFKIIKDIDIPVSDINFSSIDLLKYSKYLEYMGNTYMLPSKMPIVKTTGINPIFYTLFFNKIPNTGYKCVTITKIPTVWEILSENVYHNKFITKITDSIDRDIPATILFNGTMNFYDENLNLIDKNAISFHYVNVTEVDYYKNPKTPILTVSSWGKNIILSGMNM